jgi:DNA-binding CsgD family transcriptional regulator
MTTPPADQPVRLDQEALSLGQRQDSLRVTPTEETIVSLIAEGLSDKMIAARLGVSYRTVRTHLERLYARARLHCRAEAVGLLLLRGHQHSSLMGAQLPLASRSWPASEGQPSADCELGGRGDESEGLARSTVEPVHDGVEVLLREGGEDHSAREMLTQQPVGVLV